MIFQPVFPYSPVIIVCIGLVVSCACAVTALAVPTQSSGVLEEDGSSADVRGHNGELNTGVYSLGRQASARLLQRNKNRPKLKPDPSDKSTYSKQSSFSGNSPSKTDQPEVGPKVIEKEYSSPLSEHGSEILPRDRDQNSNQPSKLLSPLISPPLQTQEREDRNSGANQGLRVDFSAKAETARGRTEILNFNSQDETARGRTQTLSFNSRDQIARGRPQIRHQTQLDLGAIGEVSYSPLQSFGVTPGDVEKYLLEAYRVSTTKRPTFGAVGNGAHQFSLSEEKLTKNWNPNLVSQYTKSPVPATPIAENPRKDSGIQHPLLPDMTLAQLMSFNNAPLTLGYISSLLGGVTQDSASNTNVLSTLNDYSFPSLKESYSYPYSSVTSKPTPVSLQNHQASISPGNSLFSYLQQICPQKYSTQQVPDNIFWDIVAQLTTQFPKDSYKLQQRSLFDSSDSVNNLSIQAGAESPRNFPLQSSEEEIYLDSTSPDHESTHECIKDTWCGVGIAAALTTGTGSALAVPVYSPAVSERQGRTLDYIVLSPNTASEFTNNYMKLLRNDSFNVSQAMKLLFKALHDVNDESARNVFRQIENFIKNNKEKLLYITIEEVEKEGSNRDSSPIPEMKQSLSTASAKYAVPNNHKSKVDQQNSENFSDRSFVDYVSDEISWPLKYSLDLNSFLKTSLTPVVINYNSEYSKLPQNTMFMVSSHGVPGHSYNHVKLQPTAKPLHQDLLHQTSALCETLQNNKIFQELLTQLTLIGTNSQYKPLTTEPPVTHHPTYQYSFNYIHRPIPTPAYSSHKPSNSISNQVYYTQKPGYYPYGNHNHHVLNTQHSYSAPVTSYSHKVSSSQNLHRPLSNIAKPTSSTSSSSGKPSGQAQDFLSQFGSESSSILLNLPLPFNPLSSAYQSGGSGPSNKPYPYPHHLETSTRPPVTTYPSSIHYLSKPGSISSYTEYQQDNTYRYPFQKHKYSANVTLYPSETQAGSIPVVPPVKNKQQISLQAQGFYKTVCSAVANDDIPDNEIIRFIAEKCAVFQYSGIV